MREWIFGGAAALCLAGAALMGQAPGGGRTGAQLPDGAGRDVTQKVCGATCHGPDMFTGKGRTRDDWTAVVNSMVARGAKASEGELVQIAEYLASHFGPNMKAAAAPALMARNTGPVGSRGKVVGKGPGVLGAGAADSHVVDDAGAERGKALYIGECVTCHGPKARGGSEQLPKAQRGADLIRSLIVLHDRYGSEIGPFLAKGHSMQSGRASASLKTDQVADLAHFLHQKVYFTLRNGPELKIQNVLTGDKKAGEEYFNGAGQCKSCHSPTGDLKGIGNKYDPPTLQAKFLFPRAVGFGRGPQRFVAKPVTVTVTTESGETIEGPLVALDDFNVSLRDSQGNYRGFKITPGMKIVKHDPYAKHVELLDQYTDKNMHDIVAYLESLK